LANFIQIKSKNVLETSWKKDLSVGKTRGICKGKQGASNYEEDQNKRNDLNRDGETGAQNQAAKVE
jgi:hypothetical protein